MRYFRALAGGLGASGSLVAAAVVLIGVLSAGLAFHGWPGRDAPGRGSTELSVVPGERGAASAGATLDVALPVAPPVPDRARRTSSSSSSRAARRRAAARKVAPRALERPSSRRPIGSRPTYTPKAGAAPSAPGGGDDATREPATTSTRTPSGGGQGPPLPPAPSLPGVPAPPAPPVAPNPSQVVGDLTQAAGGAVQQTTQNVADAVRPVSPAVAQAVEQTGQVVGDTVGQVGQAVGGLLGGLGAANPR